MITIFGLCFPFVCMEKDSTGKGTSYFIAKKIMFSPFVCMDKDIMGKEARTSVISISFQVFCREELFYLLYRPSFFYVPPYYSMSWVHLFRPALFSLQYQSSKEDYHYVPQKTTLRPPSCSAIPPARAQKARKTRFLLSWTCRSSSLRALPM